MAPGIPLGGSIQMAHGIPLGGSVSPTTPGVAPGGSVRMPFAPVPLASMPQSASFVVNAAPVPGSIQGVYPAGYAATAQTPQMPSWFQGYGQAAQQIPQPTVPQQVQPQQVPASKVQPVSARAPQAEEEEATPKKSSWFGW